MTWSFLIKMKLLFCLVIFITIIRRCSIQIKILFDAPIAELIKGNTPTPVGVYGPEVFPWIREHPNPFLEQILSLYELLYLDHSISTRINNFKGLEILISLSESNEKYSKFNAFNVFVFYRHFLFLF